MKSSGKDAIRLLGSIGLVALLFFLPLIHVSGTTVTPNGNALTYRAFATFYTKLNGTYKVKYKPNDVLLLKVKPNGNEVFVTLSPMPLDMYRKYSIQLLKNSIVFSPTQPGNVTADELYKEYLINQMKNNMTYIQALYKDYLDYVKTNNISVVYYLSEDNYVTNFPEVGFFPLYSVKPLTPKLIDKEKPVYFGHKIKDYGISSIGIANINLSGFFLHLGVDNFVISGDGSHITVDLLFKKNYFVYGSGIFLPVNKTTYVLLNLEPTNETMRFLDTVPGYNIMGPDYTLPLIISAVVIGVGAAGFAVWRRRR